MHDRFQDQEVHLEPAGRSLQGAGLHERDVPLSIGAGPEEGVLHRCPGADPQAYADGGPRDGA